MVLKCQRFIIIMAHMYSFASDGSVLFVWQTRFTKLSKLSIRIPFGPPDENKLLGTYILAGLSIKKMKSLLSVIVKVALFLKSPCLWG